MKAAVFSAPGEPLSIEDVPDPQPLAGEMVLRVKSCGICGSDLHWATNPGAIPPGTVMGHEFAGEVVELGPEAGDRFRVGQRACALPFIGCRRCAACLAGDPGICPEVRTTGLGAVSGAYAEYVRVGVNEALPLPEGVTNPQGALVEPLAVGLHAVKKSQLRPGADVLVVGAGPIGLAVALWARFFGARRVVVSEKASARRDLAAAYGATDSLDPSAVEVGPELERRLGRVPEVIFECVGVKGLLQDCLALAPTRGQVVVVGVCMQPDVIVPAIGIVKEISVQFVVAYEVEDFAFSIAMIEQGRIASTEMITDVVDFAGFSAAFEALKQPSTQCKVLLEP